MRWPRKRRGERASRARRHSDGVRTNRVEADSASLTWNAAIDEAIERAARRRRSRGAPAASGRRCEGMRIAAFADVAHPSSHYRAVHPLAELMRRGHEVALHAAPRELAIDDDEAAVLAADFDVAFLARYKQREAWQLARRLRRAGLPVVWDYDDDVFTPREAIAARSMFRSATVMTTTSAVLAGRYRRRGARRVLVVPNYLTAPSFATRRLQHDGLVVGYIGWVDHQLDWDGLRLSRVMSDLLAASPPMRVESFGPIDLRLPAERYRRFGPVPFEVLPQAIARFDIGLAPLVDKPGNATRSDIKLKEYGALGVPWLASPYGAYRGYGEQQGGRLVPSHGWRDAIAQLVADPGARGTLGANGVAWAREHSLEKNAGAWERALQVAVGSSDARKQAEASMIRRPERNANRRT